MWYTEESDKRIARDFQCNSLSTMEYRLTMYWATQQDQAEFYVTELGAGQNGVLWYQPGTDGTVIGTGADMNADAPSVEASDPVTQYTLTRSFQVDAGDIVTLLMGGNVQADAYGFNRFRIRCVQINTNAPSSSPTESTWDPTTIPTYDPTPAPTDNPTPAPTDDPTESPVTQQPTENPVTQAPSDNPTEIPTREPTKQPTIDPTENPTPRPTTPGQSPPPTLAPTPGKY